MTISSQYQNYYYLMYIIINLDRIYFRYDAPFFSFVHQHMYLWLKETKYPELELGTYYHYADNIHYYERHFAVANKILKHNMKTPPLFKLKRRMFDIDESGNFRMGPDVFDFCESVYDTALTEKDENLKSDYQQYVNLISPWVHIEGTNYKS